MGPILVVGGITYDSLIYLDTFPGTEPRTIFSQGYAETIGGTGAGKALNLKRLGADVTLHAMIGADAAGDQVRARFAAEKLPFIGETDPAGTERHTNLMSADGERISIYTHYATFAPAIDMDRLEALIVAHDVIALNIINYCRHAIPLARRHNKPIWCDVHDYDGQSAYHQDFVQAADYLFLSSSLLPDYRAFMLAQIEQGKRMVVCTHGKDGATALTAAGDWIDTPALPYPLRDSSGAGDSFFAGVLYAHLRGAAPEIALRTGAVVAGLCIASPELYGLDLSPAQVAAEYQRHYGTAPC